MKKLIQRFTNFLPFLLKFDISEFIKRSLFIRCKHGITDSVVIDRFKRKGKFTRQCKVCGRIFHTENKNYKDKVKLNYLYGKFKK